MTLEEKIEQSNYIHFAIRTFLIIFGFLTDIVVGIFYLCKIVSLEYFCDFIFNFNLIVFILTEVTIIVNNLYIRHLKKQ